VDATGSTVRAVLIERRGEDYDLLGVGEAPGAGEQAEAVRAACRAAGGRRAKVALALPRAETVVRSVRLPVADAGNTEQMLQLEAAYHVPFPAEGLAFGFATLPTAEGAEAEHVVAAASGEAVVAWRRVLAEAGRNAAWLAAPGPALAALVAGGNPVVVLHLHDRLGIDVWDGRLVLSRGTEYGGGEARGLTAERLAAEVERSLLACPSLDKGLEVVLVGEHASEALAAELATRIALPCRCWQSDQVTRLHTGETRLGPAYALAVGTALQALSGPATLNLHSRAAAGVRQGRSRAVVVGLLAIPALLLVAALIATAQPREGEAARQAALRGEVARLERQAAKIRATEAGLKSRLAQEGFVEPMRVLAERAPAGIWLTSLAWGTGGEGSARGRALDAEAVARLVSRLTESEAFTDLKLAFVRQSKVGKTPVVEFGLSWQTEEQP